MLIPNKVYKFLLFIILFSSISISSKLIADWYDSNITYYKITDGKIGLATTSETVAKSVGLDQKTEKNIVHGYDGQLYFEDECPPPPEPTYAEKRAAEYPSVQEQLDMIYWDKINGTNVWQQTITAIKTKYPKA